MTYLLSCIGIADFSGFACAPCPFEIQAYRGADLISRESFAGRETEIYHVPVLVRGQSTEVSVDTIERLNARCESQS